ncbi:TRAP transporter large permease subunit, partial [Nitratireductor aquibiodomus]
MAWPIGMALLLALIFAGVPIAFAMTAVGLIGVVSIVGWHPALAMLGQVFFDSGRSYTLSVVPLFLLMGNLVVQSGVAGDLYAAANAWLRHR